MTFKKNIYLIINFIVNIFMKKNNSLIVFSNKINKYYFESF